MHSIEITIEHLCQTCRFTEKCIRFKGINKALDIMEENALDKWRVDVDVDFSVRSCDLYSADDVKMAEFVNQVVEEYMEENGLDEDEQGD